MTSQHLLINGDESAWNHLTVLDDAYAPFFYHPINQKSPFSEEVPLPLVLKQGAAV